MNLNKVEIECEKISLDMHRNSKWVFFGLAFFNAFMATINFYALYRYGRNWNSFGAGVALVAALYSLAEWQRYKNKWKESKRRLRCLTEINWDNNWDKNI